MILIIKFWLIVHLAASCSSPILMKLYMLIIYIYIFQVAKI